MSTRIDLKHPYSEDFKAGYLNINKEPRRVVTLVGKDGSKSSTSYARYLMACHLGRYLKNDEHVDHIDNDKLNDVVDNLQILSSQENNRKRLEHYDIKKNYKTLTCPICEKEFTREVRKVNFKLKQCKSPTCSRRCGGKMSHITLARNSSGS